MIRFVGFAYPDYDFGETNNQRSIVPRLPDGSSFAGVPSQSALLFTVTADPGGRQLRSDTFILNPGSEGETAAFACLRECLDALNPNRRVYCTQCGVSIANSEPLCVRCGAKQFSVESLCAESESLESRVGLQVANLSAAQQAVMATDSSQEAAKEILSKPLTLMPDRPSPHRHILRKNRIWTTRESMSDKEFDALAQDDLDRKQARKQGAVERHQESTPPAHRPSEELAATADASYQTAPLADYRDSLQRQAEALFDEVRKSVGGRAKRYPGSYSILARSSGATAAKIVIFQQGVALAKENGSFPPLRDGIYVLLRTSEETGRSIWNSGIVQTLGFGHRFDPDTTIGIAPKHHVRFAYFQVTDQDLDGRIVELLAQCSIVR